MLTVGQQQPTVRRGPRGPCGLKYTSQDNSKYLVLVEAREGLVD